MKGFIEVAGKPMRLLVQGVGQRFRQQFDRPWGAGEDRRSRLVVIGEKGLDRAAIAAALGG
jgi:cobalamin biosynthesis protein CobW